MLEVRSAGQPSIKLVKSANSSGDIMKELSGRGYVSYTFRPNIYRIKRLNIDQYPIFLNLLSLANSYARTNYAIAEKDKLPLILPEVDSLRTIRFDKLLDNPIAMSEVMGRCVMPQGRLGVNLSILPWLFQTYVVRSPNL